MEIKTHLNNSVQVCQNCKNEFNITQDDFSFYSKIDVPAPTFCFDCRAQRRMMFRNERVMYKRTNNAPNKNNEQIISIHNPEADVTVYDDRTWWSDAWDPMDYGFEYDFSKTFFQQFKQLYRSVPLISLSVTNNMNCTYCNVSEGDKVCHMLSGSEHNEDTIYGNRVVENKQSGDLYIAFQNEACYELTNCTKCFKTLYSMNSQECSDSYFLMNCKNCIDCIGCINLRSKSRCIFNQQYTKEEYDKLKKEFNLNTIDGVRKFKEMFDEFSKTQFFRYANNVKSEGSTGDNLVGVAKSQNIFDFQEAENIKNCFWGLRMKDSQDAGPGVGMGSELVYDVVDQMGGHDVCFTSVVYHSFNVKYSINCHSSTNLFGCYGLRTKEYCIFNRQYSKKEYEELVPKIIAHMKEMPYVDSKGRIFSYGEFFPYDISPFAYNETIAQEYFPISKEQAIDKGFEWYEREERNYQTTIKSGQIPQTIDEVQDTFINEIIECSGGGNAVRQCTQAFKIIPQELELYRKLNVPLPEFCYNCRHYNRLQKRNPMKLWHRACMCDRDNHEHQGKCQNEFETSYAPNREEIIFCEKCYQAEVM
ncbi:hypothetical protein IT400_01075 [Candidatus Nomurabacteria bacterium]|nr:hypothetical protein [Candidatus Nomurabacteria bacterium]